LPPHRRWGGGPRGAGWRGGCRGFRGSRANRLGVGSYPSTMLRMVPLPIASRRGGRSGPARARAPMALVGAGAGLS
jgi:hypothetical protein